MLTTRMFLKIQKEAMYGMIIFVLTILMLFSSYPYMFFQVLPIPNIKLLAVFFLFVFFFLLLFKSKIKLPPRIFLYTIVVQILFLFFSFIYHADSTYITRIVIVLLIVLSLICICNTKYGLFTFVKFYNNIILLMAVAGTLCFILLLLVPFPPIAEFVNPDGRTGYFFGLSFTNFRIGNIIRYAGFFDEPGAMANWGMFALVFNRLFIHNRKYEMFLSICLLFTFSLAYYIQLFLFLFLLKKIKWTSAACLFVFIVLIVGVIYTSKDTSIDIYRLTLGRFEIDGSTEKIRGDNRSELAEKAKEQFVRYPFMGQGAQKITDMDYMADNPYETLAKDGILGTIITYLPLIIILIYKWHNKPYVYAVLLFSVGYMQRPFHIDFLHPMMLYSMFLAMITYNNVRSNSYETEYKSIGNNSCV